MREGLFVGEGHLNRQVAARRPLTVPADAIAVTQERLLVGGERRIDRIDGHDRRQQRRGSLPTRHEIAAGHERTAHTSVDWRDHSGELEVELRRAECGGDCVNMRGGFGRRAGPPLALLQRHGVVGCQPVRPPHFRRRAIARARCLCQLGAQPLDLGEEGAVVELKEQLSLADQAAFLERDGRDQSRDTRTDADRLHRFEAAGELVPFRHLTSNRGCRRHLGERRRGGCLNACARGGEGDRRQYQPCPRDLEKLSKHGTQDAPQGGPSTIRQIADRKVARTADGPLVHEADGLIGQKDDAWSA